ncbi:MAG: hypothetical protein Tsb0020_45010 [Haliangiales bacterium]
MAVTGAYCAANVAPRALQRPVAAMAAMAAMAAIAAMAAVAAGQYVRIAPRRGWLK